MCQEKKNNPGRKLKFVYLKNKNRNWYLHRLKTKYKRINEYY
jgi:hypothetical protein